MEELDPATAHKSQTSHGERVEEPTGDLPPVGVKPNPGWFQPGHMRSPWKHGRRSQRVQLGLMPEQSEARALLQERVAEVLADLGGKEALSTVASGMVERHCQLEVVAEYFWQNLLRHGP